LQVSGLARRIKEFGVLGDTWRKLVEVNFQELRGDQVMLTRRVATRWNADFVCLHSHIFFRVVVEAFTGQSANRCRSFRLDDIQWKMAEQLEELLLVSTKSLEMRWHGSDIVC
jgi:hypothetical protein